VAERVRRLSLKTIVIGVIAVIVLWWVVNLLVGAAG